MGFTKRYVHGIVRCAQYHDDPADCKKDKEVSLTLVTEGRKFRLNIPEEKLRKIIRNKFGVTKKFSIFTLNKLVIWH
jgi:hypothetical protein